MSGRRRRKPWSNKDWQVHSLACWREEWQSYRDAAGLAGCKSVNGWIRLWLNEAVLFERANAREREDLE